MFCFHKFVEVRRYFTPKISRAVSGADKDSAMKMAFGFTTHISRCSKCDKEEAYETYGEDKESEI